MNEFIRMEGITKRFPGVTANDDVTIDFRKGEVHALLGENGAGKTTIMNVLYGLLKPNEGRIFLEGEEVNITNPLVAIDYGIGMVHQHFKLIPKFTVAENIVLGTKLEKEPLLDLKNAIQKIEELSASTGLNVNLQEKVKNLSIGEQQRVEILKALYRGAKLLIMDEPTSVLTPQEVDELFEFIRRWVDGGNSVVLITHKMREVFSISNRISVLRDGRLIDTIPNENTNEDMIAEMMVGRRIMKRSICECPNVGNEVFRIEDYSVADETGKKQVDQISFSIRAGEIYGIAGVDGNGQEQLIEAILGLIPVCSGDVFLNGTSIKDSSLGTLINLGVSNIPFSRQAEGLALNFSIEENLILKERWDKTFLSGMFLSRKKIRNHAAKAMKKFNIKAKDTQTQVKNMSGGNQQKVVIAREIERNPKLIIACNPTHGLDIGAIEFIHRQLVEQRDNGVAILLVSTELDELFQLSDRMMVLYKGKSMGVVESCNTSVEKVGLMMLGKDLN